MDGLRPKFCGDDIEFAADREKKKTTEKV